MPWGPASARKKRGFAITLVRVLRALWLDGLLLRFVCGKSTLATGRQRVSERLVSLRRPESGWATRELVVVPVSGASRGNEWISFAWDCPGEWL